MNIPNPEELKAALLDVVRVAASELTQFSVESKRELAKLEAPIESYLKRLERIVDVNALAALVQWDAAHNTDGQHAPDVASARKLTEMLQERGALP